MVAISQSKMETRVRVAICQILDLSTDCESQAAGGDEQRNFLPVYCDALVKSHNEHLATNIWFVHIGADFSIMWEKLANGEVWITVVPNDYHVGGTFHVGQKLKVTGDVHLAFGDTYQFQSDDEAHKWMKTLENNVNENNPTSWRFWNPFDGNKKDVKPPAIKSQEYGLEIGGEAGIEVPTKNVDLGVDGKAKIGGSVIKEDWHFWDQKKHKYSDSTSYTYKLSGEYSVDASAQVKDGSASVGGHVGAGQKWTASVRYMYNPDGTIANIRWITTYNKQVTGGVNIGPGKKGSKKGSENGPKETSSKPQGKKPPASPKKGKRSKPKAQKQQGGKKGSKGRKNKNKKVQKNRNNKNQRQQSRRNQPKPTPSATPTTGGSDPKKRGPKVRIKDQTRKKSPSAGEDITRSHEVTRMTQLNFDDPNDPAIAKDPLKKADAERQQRIARNYIHQHGVVPPVPIMNAITGKTNAVTEDPGVDADPMTRLLYDRGKAWEWNSHNSKITKNLVDSDPIEVSISDETKVTQGAKYLAGPKNGHREYVDFPACTAQGAPSKHDTKLDGY